MNIKKPFLLIWFLFFPLLLLSAREEEEGPKVHITIAKARNYQRPVELLDKDRQSGLTFPFHPGIEILTNLDSVKVFIFDMEAGRTPYENSGISPGRLRIKLEKPGYEDLTFWADVLQDSRTSIHVEYGKQTLSPLPDENRLPEQSSAATYSRINPSDPLYYRSIAEFGPEESPPKHITIKKGPKALLALSPRNKGSRIIFSWDGRDALNQDIPSGEYGFRLGKQTFPLKRDRNFSRRQGAYFSGVSGLVLVPRASMLFPGSYELASGVLLERMRRLEEGSINLPFSFLFRISPLKGWEAAIHSELAFITESNTPSFKLNTSQKVMLVKRFPFQCSAIFRGTWHSAVNDFQEKLKTSVMRDPAGFSLHLPLQYNLKTWIFYLDPEYLFSLKALEKAGKSSSWDMDGALRWGIAYEGGSFSTALSSALFFPSLRKSAPLMQLALEGSYFPKYTALYITAFVMEQHSRIQKDFMAWGLNIGFIF